MSKVNVLKIKHPDNDNLISKVKAKAIISDGKKLGEGPKVKDCYWSGYEYDNKFYLCLNDEPDVMHLLNKESVNYYLED